MNPGNKDEIEKYYVDYHVVELDIRGVQIVYFPMYYNRKWENSFHEYVSEIPSEPGKLIILEKKIFRKHRENGLKYKRFIYKKSENQKELYFRSTCGLAEYENLGGINFEIQKPANVKIVFYEDLTKTHFFTEEEYKRELKAWTFVSDPEDITMTTATFFDRIFNGWSICPDAPTTMKHLPGIHPSKKLTDEDMHPSTMETNETVSKEFRKRKPHTAEGSHHLDDPECAHRRELFYQSVEEHNRQVRPY